MGRWHSSQQELYDRISVPAQTAGMQLEIVRAQYLAGDEIFHKLERETASGPGIRVVTIGSEYGDWGAVCDLSRISGTIGSAQTDRIWSALKALSESGKRPLSIVIDDVQLLKAQQMEALVLCFGRAARNQKIALSVFMIAKRHNYWREKMGDSKGKQVWAGQWELAFDFPRYPKLFSELRKTGKIQVSNLSREGGLEQFTSKQVREEIEERVALAS